MRSVEKDRFLLYGSLAGFGLFACSFLLMAPISARSSAALDIAAGLCFWISLAAGIAGQVLLTLRRKKWEARTGRENPVPRVGLLNVCRNQPGKYADAALAVCAACLAVSLPLNHYAGPICFVFLSLTVFALAAHCIFNGKNYSYVKTRDSKKPGGNDPAKEDEK